jgi:hypothetical protein
VLFKVGVVPVFFIIDVFYSSWNLIKLGHKIIENYKVDKHIQSLPDYRAPVEQNLEEEENLNEEQKEIKRKQQNEAMKICSICLGEILSGKYLSCGHIFHLKCLK